METFSYIAIGNCYLSVHNFCFIDKSFIKNLFLNIPKLIKIIFSVIYIYITRVIGLHHPCYWITSP